MQASRPYLLSSCPKGETSLLHGGIWPWLFKQGHCFCTAVLLLCAFILEWRENLSESKVCLLAINGIISQLHFLPGVEPCSFSPRRLFFFFFFLQPHVRQMEAPGLGAKQSCSCDLYHNHGNTKSEPHLQPMPQLVEMPDT